MRIDEIPLIVGNIEEIKHVGKDAKGKKGEVFIFRNDRQERLVVKLQSDPAVGAVAGTAFLRHAGVRAPATRAAGSADVERLTEAARQYKPQGSLPGEFSEVTKEFLKAQEDWKIVVLMDFAEGDSLGTMIDNYNLELIGILFDADFLTELGTMIAVDVFTGNPDRMFAGRLAGKGLKPQGWFNPGNIFITADRKPVAIDNEFKPDIGNVSLPWGLWTANGQLGSIAAASDSLMREEAGHLFDAFMDAILKKCKEKEPEQFDEMQVFIQALVRTRKGIFVDKLARAATAALKQLLTRGQGWRAFLAAAGVDDESLLRKFRFRRRVLRQVAAGVEPTIAYNRANFDYANKKESGKEIEEKRKKNVLDYHRWSIVVEHGASEQIADLVLKDGINGYRKFKKLSKRL